MQVRFSRKWTLIIFMIGTFSVGMTEYVVTGLLTQFANDLNVAVSTTGLLLSAYALSVAVFGPVLRMVTIKFSSKPLLISLMIIFIISNVVAATAANFEILLLSRLLSATMHAPFFGLCMSVAVQISSPRKHTSAIAAVQGGLTISIMLGVPLGAYLGGAFDWRSVFWLMAMLGVITLLGLIFVAPNVKMTGVPQLKKELRMFKNRSVLLVIAIIVFGFSGVFTAYTFMEPMIRYFSGFSVMGVTLSMFFFGLGAVIGNFASGQVPEHRLNKNLMMTMATLTIVLMLFTTLLKVPLLALIISSLFGAGTFGSTPLLNSKIILAATEAPMLSGTIAAAVFNVANFIGATLGTLLLNNGLTYNSITFIAAGMILFGLLLTLLMDRVESK